MQKKNGFFLTGSLSATGGSVQAGDYKRPIEEGLGARTGIQLSTSGSQTNSIPESRAL